MKKRLLTILTVLAVSCLSCFALSACKNYNSTDESSVTPTIEISQDGYWVINGVKTEHKAIGVDGADGINGTNGTNGTDGVTPTIEISQDGYWIINGVKTEHKAIGVDGADGIDGTNGTDGTDGVGILDMYISKDGFLMVKYTNSNEYVNIGKLVDNSVSRGLLYELNEDGQSYSVVGIGDCRDEDIIIPSTYNAKPVTIVGDFAFKSCSSIKSVIIPNSVTGIGFGSFEGCNSIEKMTLPTLNGTGYARPYSVYCSHIIHDYDNTTPSGYLGYMFGAPCYETNRYMIPSSLKSIVITGTTNIEDYAFFDCCYLENITFDKNSKITTIGEGSFAWCHSLTSIEIPDGVTSIGVSAFSECNSLQKILIPNSVTRIGDRAFYISWALNISFGGTVAEWNNIIKGDDWNLGLNTTKVICTDGEV